MAERHDIRKDELLRELGYGGDVGPIDELLEAAGLSHPRKVGIHASKVDDVRALLDERVLLVCRRGDCQSRARSMAGGRIVAPAATQADCAICGGSVIQQSVQEMIAACRRAAWKRIVVVGGSPNTRQQLETAAGDALELRLIDGAVARNRAQARADLKWADHVVLWGTTILDHKVSNLYNGHAKTSTVPRRSVAELAAHVARMAGKSVR